MLPGLQDTAKVRLSPAQHPGHSPEHSPPPLSGGREQRAQSIIQAACSRSAPAPATHCPVGPRHERRARQHPEALEAPFHHKSLIVTFQTPSRALSRGRKPRAGSGGAAPPPGGSREPASRPGTLHSWGCRMAPPRSSGASDLRRGCWLRAKRGREPPLPRVKRVRPKELARRRTSLSSSKILIRNENRKYRRSRDSAFCSFAPSRFVCGQLCVTWKC